jgi:VanZ family protein
MTTNSTTPRFGRDGHKLWCAALAAYWLAIFAATHVPKDFPGVPSGHEDKLAHFAAYAILAIAFATTWQSAAGILIGAHLRFIWVLLIAYGAIDELTQPLAGREASWLDWLADGAGAAVGLAAFRWFARWREIRSTSAEIDQFKDQA